MRRTRSEARRIAAPVECRVYRQAGKVRACNKIPFMNSPEPLPESADLDRRFGALSCLYGPEAPARIRNAHVAVAGLGGVGSWTVEALARQTV